jgi:hypothetical protein
VCGLTVGWSDKRDNENNDSGFIEKDCQKFLWKDL